MALNSGRPGNPLTWIWTTAIEGIRGRRPLGDISPGQRTFGPFFEQIFTPRPAPPPPLLPPPAVPQPQPLPPAPADDEPDPYEEENDRYERRERRPRIPWGDEGDLIVDPLPNEPIDTTPRYPLPEDNDEDGAIRQVPELWPGATQAFVAPLPPQIPVPVLAPVGRTIVGVLARTAARILGIPGFIFWPGRTADDDLGYEAQPQPKGPPRRPVVRPTTAPAWPAPDWWNYPQPKAPPRRLPRRFPWENSPISPSDNPFWVPEIWQQPIPQPRPTPTPRPTATPRPTLDPLELLPYLLPFIRPGIRPLPTRFPVPTPQPQPFPTPIPTPIPTPFPTPFPPGFIDPIPFPPPGVIPTPLTPFQPQPIPLRPTNCPPCTREKDRKRKRKKRQPRNVCYRGTFYETARSTRKYRKEKIPCQ